MNTKMIFVLSLFILPLLFKGGSSEKISQNTHILAENVENEFNLINETFQELNKTTLHENQSSIQKEDFLKLFMDLQQQIEVQNQRISKLENEKLSVQRVAVSNSNVAFFANFGNHNYTEQKKSSYHFL